jgi:hypothetical protein
LFERGREKKSIAKTQFRAWFNSHPYPNNKHNTNGDCCSRVVTERSFSNQMEWLYSNSIDFSEASKQVKRDQGDR